MNELIQYARKVSEDRPDLKDEIIDILELAKAEIEDGNSIENEVDLAHSSIRHLLGKMGKK